MDNNILTVKQVTQQVAAALKCKMSFMWVRGEVSSLRFADSGHIYFDLKEDTEILHCVWFRGKQRPLTHDPLTGEVWEDGTVINSVAELANGKEFICAGNIGVYGPQGVYQLIIDFALSAGIGILYREFERLKLKLSKLGLFEPSHKKPIPFSPRRVAVITAPTGAAIQDFLRISGERGTGATIRIYPVSVQGAEASARITSALKQAAKDNWAEVIVLIRGGGSMTDLWVFNDEKIAYAIYESPIPVLTGIGHEIDHSIADLVADRAAATPSHTAQLLWKEKRIIEQELDQWEFTLTDQLNKYINRCSREFAYFLHTLMLLSPLKKIQNKIEKIESVSEKLERTFRDRIRTCETGLDKLEKDISYRSDFIYQRNERLNNLEKELNRLSSFPEKKSECLNLLEMKLHSLVRQKTVSAEHTVETLIYRFNYLKNNVIDKDTNLLEQLSTKLESLDPYNPVRRGYAIITEENGEMLRFTNNIFQGKILKVILKEDILTVTVNSIKHNQTD